MRRLTTWLLVVALGAGGSAALAGTAAAKGTRESFCKAAQRVADDHEGFDPTSLSDREFVDRVERVYRKLAKRAPRSLESAFARITDFYGMLADAGSTVPEDPAAFVEDAPKVRRALNKVFRYLSKKCELEL